MPVHIARKDSMMFMTDTGTLLGFSGVLAFGSVTFVYADKLRKRHQHRDYIAGVEADTFIGEMTGELHPRWRYDDDLDWGDDEPEPYRHKAYEYEPVTSPMAVIRDEQEYPQPEVAVITAIQPPRRTAKPVMLIPELATEHWTDQDTDIMIRYMQESMRAFMIDLIGAQELAEAEAAVAMAGGPKAVLTAGISAA